MIGIYKITNKINGKVYIGQSIHINRRWQEHCKPSTKSAISDAIKKYGKENFSFEILEECTKEELDTKEAFYIKYFNSIVPNGYNISAEMTGCHTSFMYYTPNILNCIYKELEDNVLTMVEIADKYNIDKSTVSRINNGEIHIDENRKYPIRKIYKNEHKEEKFCCDCGIKISYQSIRCNNCENKRRKEKAKNDKPISREELKQLIRTTPFTKIGKMFNVSDNAIRKWCKLYNLPFRVKDIKSYSNEEWNNI